MESDEQHQYTSTRDLTLEGLMDDIAYELADARFEGRTHARNDVYRDGCRGPLCKYRERTRKREAREARTRANLPGGVQPSRRTRCEQKWDDVIQTAIEEVRDLGVDKWLDSYRAVRAIVPVPSVAGSTVLGPVHPEGGSACGDAVALRLLQSAAPRVPVQRIGGQAVRS